ncbi:hypothetical protein N7486_002383 [Penicillium sp. IBT 16267x]|nr:hypothetical protein N7486_002383 [Penicillium sp. IBT 16267x]
MAPKIFLYTANHCPWAHPAQIALRELCLEFETVLVDINIPRTPDISRLIPVGSLITQFLVDSHPSHLLKSSSEPGGAWQRFNVTFFVESYFTKAHCFFDTALSHDGDEITAAYKYIDAIGNHIEPLLVDAVPFFGGSCRVHLQRGSHLISDKD